MPRNNNGTFERIKSWKVEAAQSKNISAADMDTDTDDIADALTGSMTRDAGDGGSPITDINWNDKKITNLQDGTDLKDAVTYGQLLSGKLYTDVSTTPNLIRVPLGAHADDDWLTAGTRILVLCKNANSSDATIPGGDWQKGDVVIYNTSNNEQWQVLGMDRTPRVLESGTIAAGSIREFVYIPKILPVHQVFCLVDRTANIAAIDLGNVVEVSNSSGVAKRDLSNMSGLGSYVKYSARYAVAGDNSLEIYGERTNKQIVTIRCRMDITHLDLRNGHWDSIDFTAKLGTIEGYGNIFLFNTQYFYAQAVFMPIAGATYYTTFPVSLTQNSAVFRSIGYGSVELPPGSLMVTLHGLGAFNF